MAFALVRAAIQADTPIDERQWIDSALSRHDADACLSAFRAASRVLGEKEWTPSAEGAELLATNRLEWLGVDATRAEIVRILLLTRACALTTEPRTIVTDWYVHGNDLEKRAVTRALWLLPRPKRFADIASLAVVSPSRPPFQGICIANPYPAAYLDKQSMSFMVERARSLAPEWVPMIVGAAQAAAAE